jgi:hypothetical protein
MATVVQLGRGPVVGIALQDKGADLGVVKSMVSVGFNALSGWRHTSDSKMMTRLQRLAAMVGATSKEAKVARQTAQKAMDKAVAVGNDVKGLQKRINRGGLRVLWLHK